MDFDIKSASDYHLNELVKLLNCGFENYFAHSIQRFRISGDVQLL